MSSMDLKIFLLVNGLRQEDFAKLVGVSRQSVSAWCCGHFCIPQRVIDFCKEYKDDSCNKK